MPPHESAHLLDRLPAGRQGPPEGAPGVSLSQRELDDAMLVAAFAQRTEDAAAALATLLRMLAPAGPGITIAPDGTWLLWAGAGQWLVVRADPAEGAAPLAEALAVPKLTDTAALIDQSDARVLITLEGPAVVCLLRRLVNIDVDPAVWPPGSAALTPIAEVPGLLAHDPTQPGRYHALVPRSYAATTLATLALLSRRYGLLVR